MAEYQVEVGFALLDRERDIDLLERLGKELEALARETGPATAIHEGRYTAALTVDAESPLDAGRVAADLLTEAMRNALAATGDELVGSFDFNHLHVDRAPVLV